MAMDKINGAPLNQPGILDRFQVSDKKKDSEKAGQLNSSGKSVPTPADRAEISDTAHQLMDLRAAVDVGRAALEGVPEVRDEKIVEVKKRLQQGYYNSQVVQDDLAGILGKVLGNLDNI